MKRWIAIIGVLLLALLAGAYAFGWRVGPGLTLIRAATLTVTDLPDGATLYVDNERRAEGAEGKAHATLTSGTHTVIVDAQNYWPWYELVTISKEGLTVSALMVPIAATGLLLEGDERETALAAIRNTKLPNMRAPLSIGEGCEAVSVWVIRNSIVGAPGNDPACSPPPYLCADGTCGETALYAPVDTIRSVLPYPGRTDTLLITFGNNVYALEINPLNPRTFAPVLSGISPSLGALPDGTPVVSDKESVFTLSL